MKWIAIDFGTHKTKALALRLEGQRLEIEDYLSFESKPEYFRGLGIPEAAAWNQVTIALNEAEWLKPDEDTIIFTALPSAYLETRYLKFPFKAEKKIEKVIQFELEAAIPFDVDEIQLRNSILEGEGVTPMKRDALVIALAYKREIIKQFEGELKKFQLSNPPMSAQILNLASLRQAITESSAFGLLSFGHSKSEFLVLQSRGNILATKTFWWGGKNLIQALGEEFSLDPEKAEHMLVHLDPEKPLTKLSAQSAAQFAVEMRQCFKGLQSQGLVLPKPFPIYVIGQASRNKALLAQIEATLKTEFDIHLKDYPISQLRGRHLMGFDRIANIEEALPALSMALAQMRAHRSKIPSFSETGFQFQQNLKKLKTGSFSILKKVAALLIAPIIYGILQIVIQQKENKVLMAQIPNLLRGTSFKLAPDETTDDLVAELKAELNTNRAKIAQLTQNDKSPLVVLTDLSKTIPSHLKIDVKDLKISQTNILVTAETNSTDTMNKILESLKTLYPQLKAGAPSNCTNSKTECKSFTFEIQRESKT